MWVVTGIPALSADDALTPYYAGLRDRGLYRLAESDCLRRLADEQITPGERAVLTIELSRTYAEHATHRGGQERDELWGLAGDVIANLPETIAAGPYRELLASQRAFVEASRGAQLRWQVELYPLDESGQAQAAAALREAIEQLQPLPAALDARVRTLIDRPPIRGRESEDPAPYHLKEIRRRVLFRTAVALVDLAKVLPTGPDRAAALHDAEAALRELTKTPKPDEAAWLAEVLLIEVLRLRGDLDRVGSQVTTLLGKTPPAAIRDAARAQWVRSELDDGRPDLALERLQTIRGEQETTSDELQCLLVEGLLAARRVAFEKQQPDLASDLLEQAEGYASNLTGAWGTRSRVLLESAREAETYGPELAASVRRAKWAWRNGDLDAAISAYHQAVGEAHRSGRAEFAVELAITMATLQTEARRFDGAAITLTGLLDSYPDSPRAADAHLLRAYALGKQYEQRPDDERRQAYRSALLEHRQKFADSPTAAEATWMLARLEEHQLNWPEANALLESISSDNKRGADAQARIASVYELARTDLERRGEPTAEWDQRAIEALRASVRSFPPPPEPLTEQQAEIAWRLARLLLGQPQPDFALADSLLERVMSGDQQHDARMANASRLRIISLAGQGRLAEARAVVRRLEAGPPDRLLDVLNGLTTAAEQVALEHKQTVGTLQLELSQSLNEQRETLSEDQRQKLDESLAQAYAALGQIPKAAAVYEKLLWQRPKNARLIESLARLYETCGTVSCLRNASVQWQALERLQKKGSPEWIESRYHMASCSHRLGNDEAARKMIGVTRVLYPDLGGPALKTKYDDLSAQLKIEKQ